MKNPNFRSNYYKNPNWDTCSKVEARRCSIIEPYRLLTGRSELPADKQYWTMCGAHYTGEDSQQSISGELGQVTSAGLIRPEQWRGVDREHDVVAKNRKFHPDAWWEQGDFYEVMRVEASNGRFNPGLVNYDGVMGPKFGVAYLKNILNLIDFNVPGPLVLVANFVLKSPYRADLNSDPRDVLRVWFKRECPCLADHWSIVPVYWHYKGGASKNSSTKMGTFILVKTAHEGHPKYTSGRNVLVTA